MIVVLKKIEKMNLEYVNVFEGLNAILKAFYLINERNLKPNQEEIPKSNNVQKNSILFSYNRVFFPETDFKQQQNTVKLVSNVEGFSLLCFELYSPTKKGIITYYVKLAEKEAEAVLVKNSPTVKDFKKMDIINLFPGTSDEVSAEKEERILKLFSTKNSFIY